MLIFVNYLKEYFRQIQYKSLLLTTLFVAILIALNFSIGIEKRIYALHFPFSLISFILFYGIVFGAGFWFQSIDPRAPTFNNKKMFIIYYSMAVIGFSLKQVHWQIPFANVLKFPWNIYWTRVLQLPLKLLMTLMILFFARKIDDDNDSFFGLTTKNFKPKPYLIILLFLIPLVALAATQPDFLHAYPKVKYINFIDGQVQTPWLWKMIYEISYSLDFVSIELFFRGFLVVGFIRFAGINAILPMAAFYCTIHFGKPLGECISSYFGGLALGVIAYRTRSIFGGLIVHLGLAWMMEFFGYASRIVMH